MSARLVRSDETRDGVYAASFNAGLNTTIEDLAAWLTERNDAFTWRSSRDGQAMTLTGSSRRRGLPAHRPGAHRGGDLGARP